MGLPKRRPSIHPKEAAILDRVRRARPPKRDESAAIELAQEFGADVADVLELYDERSGVREYEGNVSRAEAESGALQDVRDILTARSRRSANG